MGPPPGTLRPGSGYRLQPQLVEEYRSFAPTVRVNVFAPGFIETEATLGRRDWQSGRGDQLRSVRGEPAQDVTVLQDRDNLLAIMQGGSFYKLAGQLRAA